MLVREWDRCAAQRVARDVVTLVDFVDAVDAARPAAPTNAVAATSPPAFRANPVGSRVGDSTWRNPRRSWRSFLVLVDFGIRKKRMWCPMLRPQDLAVASILGEGKALSYEALAEAACLSVSEAHAAVRRLMDARIVSPERRLYAPQFIELLAHGARYVWPLKKGSVVMGLPTGGAAAMFSENDDFPEPDDLPLVWEAPDDPRAVRGIAVEPLYKKVPKAVAANNSLYAMLALVDAVRVPNARERSAGIKELQRRLQVAA